MQIDCTAYRVRSNHDGMSVNIYCITVDILIEDSTSAYTVFKGSILRIAQLNREGLIPFTLRVSIDQYSNCLTTLTRCKGEGTAGGHIVLRCCSTAIAGTIA